MSLSGSQRLMAGSGAELLEANERLICGIGAVDSPTMAEGLALAGVRAASIIGRSPTGNVTMGGQHRVPWLLHRRLDSHDVRITAGAFEMIPGGLQEAVDQCLVGHLISERISMPGVCYLDIKLGERVGVAFLSEQKLTDEILGPKLPMPLCGQDGRHPSPREVLRVAMDAFHTVSSKIGREVGPVRPFCVDDAEVLLITCGWVTKRVRLASDMLRKHGLPVGALSLGLLRPFPKEVLVPLMRRRRQILVLDTFDGDVTFNADLYHQVRSVAVELGIDKLRCVRMSGSDPKQTVRDLAAFIARHLGHSQAQEIARQPFSPLCERLAIGAAPGGHWANTLLLEIANHLGHFRPIELRWVNKHRPEMSTLLIRPPESLPLVVTQAPPDVLVLSHPSLLAASTRAITLALGGTVVIQSPAEDSAALWSSLGRRGQRLVKERQLDVWWLDAIGLSTSAEQPNDAARLLLLGAVLGASKRLEFWTRTDFSPIDTVTNFIAQDKDDHTTQTLFWLSQGTAAVNRLELTEVLKLEEASEPTFLEQARIPRLAPAVTSGNADKWRRRVRQFHLNRETNRGVGDASLGLPLRPLVLADLNGSERLDPHYPFFVPQPQATEENPVNLLERMFEAIKDLEERRVDVGIIERHLVRIVRTAREIMSEGSGALPIVEALRLTCERFTSRFDLSQAAAAAMRHQLDELLSALPKRGLLLGFGRQTSIWLTIESVRRQRRERREHFLQDIVHILTSLNDLLLLDHSHGPEAMESEALAASLGLNSFLDTEALSVSLPRHRGSKPLERARRERIAATIDVLETYLEESRSGPDWILVHWDPLPAELDTNGMKCIRHMNGCALAMGLFDGMADRMSEVFRAMRRAQLEIEEQYDPALHDELLESITWQSCSTEELVLLTPIVVIDQEERLSRYGLADFSRLMRSGRLVNVILEELVVSSDDIGSPETSPDLRTGVGMITVAIREAYVAQTSLSRPRHLLSSLERMMEVPRPGVTIVATPQFRQTAWPGLIADSALRGRVTPCFRYDPDAGPSWAERFDLDGNDEPFKAFSTFEVSYLDESLRARQADHALTYAEVAALNSSCREHFWVIPREAWSDEQIEIDQYLVQPQRGRRQVPFTWVVDESDVVQRAVITRELALACRDSLQAWQNLQELGGVVSEYARRAAEAAWAEAEAKAAQERTALQDAHSAEVRKVRASAATEVMDRLVSVLLDNDQVQAAVGRPSRTSKSEAGSQPPTPAKPAVAAVQAQSEPQPADLEDDSDGDQDLSLDEAYIDSFLCTTCNDCINLNPLLFKYNENRQAYIADPAAGSFAELVQAAEKCPARCIHPGKPPQGDPSVTEELIKKAGKFN